MAIKQLKLVEYHNITAHSIDGSTTFHSPKTRKLCDWWIATAHNHRPRRRDFDILEHVDLAEHLFLAKALDRERFLMKLHGESVIAMFGHNPTGHVVSADDAIETFGHALHEYYRMVLEDGRPYLCVGDLSHVDRGFIRFESIDCPLVDEDSGAFEWIIGVTEPIGG